MAISNIHETLLMYTKQKTTINEQLSNVMFDMVSASRKNADIQQQYNEKLQDLYYDPDYGYGTDEYQVIVAEYENDHEFELSSLEAWESELELEKNNLETQLNEITSFENTWTKLLQSNIKNDFSYGGAGQ